MDGKRDKQLQFIARMANAVVKCYEPKTFSEVPDSIDMFLQTRKSKIPKWFSNKDRSILTDLVASKVAINE